MKDKFIKYRIFLIVLLLAYCSVFLESPYHGNYYGEPPYFFYFFITLSCLLTYLIPTEKLTFIKKFVYAGIVSCFVLISSGILVDKIMRVIYGYDSNWHELKSPAILDSSLFYFIANFSGIGILKIWLKTKKQKKKILQHLLTSMTTSRFSSGKKVTKQNVLLYLLVIIG